MAACLEEMAWVNGWITDEELVAAESALKKTDYVQYLLHRMSMPRV